MRITRDMVHRLSASLVPLADRNGAGSIVVYAGWPAGPLSHRLLEAIGKAVAFPADLPGVQAERHAWLALSARWAAIDPNYGHLHYIRARIAALEHLLDVHPARTMDDIGTRLDWLSVAIEEADMFKLNHLLALASRILSDFEDLSIILADADLARSRQDRVSEDRSRRHAPRSNADKQHAVLHLLDNGSALSDREIARQCGVSAQMVGNWRRHRAARQ